MYSVVLVDCIGSVVLKFDNLVLVSLDTGTADSLFGQSVGGESVWYVEINVMSVVDLASVVVSALLIVEQLMWYFPPEEKYK